ncbi:hypothetical protein KR009_010421, partial [Drosophila setifemur]
NLYTLSSLLVLLGCFAWTAFGAQDEFSVRANQIAQYFGDSSISQQAKMANAGAVAAFYQKYRNRIPLSPQKRAEIDLNVQRYNQGKARVVIVDGVPRQGGWQDWSDILDKIIKVAIAIGGAIST